MIKNLTTILLAVLFLGGCSSQMSRCIEANYEWRAESYSMKFPTTNPENKLHNRWIDKLERRNLEGANKRNIIEYYFLYGFEDLTDWFFWERKYYKKREKVLKDIEKKKCNAQGIY